MEFSSNCIITPDTQEHWLQRLKICVKHTFWPNELFQSQLWVLKEKKVLVTQSCLTLWEAMDYSQSGSSIHGILQARTLEWVAIPFSKASSWPRDQTQVSCIAGRFFTIWATRLWRHPRHLAVNKPQHRIKSIPPLPSYVERCHCWAQGVFLWSCGNLSLKLTLSIQPSTTEDLKHLHSGRRGGGVSTGLEPHWRWFPPSPRGSDQAS